MLPFLIWRSASRGCKASNQLITMLGAATSGRRRSPNWRWRDARLETTAVPESKTKAAFIKPMLLLQTERLPEGSKWAYELKLDGYRALAIKTGGKVHLRSRNDNDFNLRYPAVAQALGTQPDETVIDGEVVALD